MLSTMVGANNPECELAGFPAKDLGTCVTHARDCAVPMTCYVGCIGYLHGWKQQSTCQVADAMSVYDGRIVAVVVSAGVLSRRTAELTACRAFCVDVYVLAAADIAMCNMGCADAKYLMDERIEREAYIDPLDTPLVIAGIIVGSVAVVVLCYLFIKPKCTVHFLKQEAVQQMAELRYAERKRVEAEGKADRKAERKVAKARAKAEAERLKAEAEEQKLQAARDAEQKRIRDEQRAEAEAHRVKQLAVSELYGHQRPITTAQREQEAEAQNREQEAQAFVKAEKIRKAGVLAKAMRMIGRMTPPATFGLA